MKRAFSIVLAIYGIVSPVLAEPPERRGVSVIVVSTEEEARQLRERIAAGESFALLALKHSTGRSAQDGGYLGAARLEELRPDLQRPLSRLKRGEVSAVTKVGREFFLLRWSTAQEDRWRSEYNEGLNAVLKKNYSEAVRTFSLAAHSSKKFVATDPRYAQSLLGLSQAHRLQQRYDAADPLAHQSAAILEKLLGPEHPGMIPSLENLAAIAQAQGRLDDVGKVYRRILTSRWRGQANRDHDVMEVLEDLADLLSASYFRDAQLDSAFKRFEQAVAQTPLRKELYAGIRDGMLQVQLVKEAETVMRQAVASFPNSRDIRYALAVHYAKAGMIESAANTFEEATQLQGLADPGADREQLSAIYESLARMRKFLGQTDQALAAYETSLKLNPNNLESHLGLADFYFRQGLTQDALGEYRQAVSVSPESARAYRELAEVELSLNHFPESIAAAKRAFELDPSERKSRYIEAIASMRGGRLEEGKLLLEQYEQLETEALAAQKHQREILELNRRAAVTLAEGRNDEAINLFRKALEAEPERADQERIYLNLGLALAKLGRHEEAAQTFQTMIARGNDDFLIHRSLAAEYEFLKDPRALEQRAAYLQRYDAVLKAILK